MTGKTIDNFFSPVSQSSKRLRQHLSPEANKDHRTAEMDNEKIGEKTYGQLMSDLSALLDTKIANLATKEEVSNLSRRVSDLSEDNIAIHLGIKHLQEREVRLVAKLVDLEARSRRNNLIFKGLEARGQNPEYRQVVKEFCNELFGASDSLWVNRAHPLSRDRSEIIAHLPSDADIDYVMLRVKLLQGTKYVVHRDYPREIREKRARLSAVRAEVERVAGRRRMPLIFDHLTIEGCRFTWENGCDEEAWPLVKRGEGCLLSH